MKCNECNKKINVTNFFECKCKQIYCVVHRHAEKHKCTFDYRSEKIQLDKIEATKIIKI